VRTADVLAEDLLVGFVDRVPAGPDLVGEEPGHRVERGLVEADPRRVVRLPAVLRATHRVRHELRGHDQALPFDVERDGLGRRHLAGADGTPEQVGHLRRALHGGDVPPVVDGRGHPRVERAEGRHHDAGLAERGQHLLDVGQERRGRPDDEHAGTPEAVAVGVEQVGRPVQCHGGLAGAGSALHDEHALERRPDDAVLFALDRRDDVGHPAGAFCGHGREQRALALQVRPLVVVERGVEDLVLDVHDGAALERQVPSGPHAHRVRRGGLVERARARDPPVEQERSVLVVAEAHPTDVPERVVVRVGVRDLETAEDEPVADAFERRDGVLVEPGEGVALAPTLVVATDGLSAGVGQTRGGVGRQLVETAEQAVDVVAFAVDLGRFGNGRFGHTHPPGQGYR
jgi:hypothetical protein